jgi:hypothetical protein
MKCYVPPTPLTERQGQRIEKNAIKSNTEIMEYADQLLCLSLRKNFGFAHKRFTKFNNEATELGRDYIEYYGQHDKNPEDYAKTGYYAILRELNNFGWDAEKILWDNGVFNNFLPDKNSAAIRKKHAECLEYAKGISFYVRENICMSALWLHNEYGWSTVPLTRLVTPVREEYLAIMREYLRCSPEGMAEMKKRMKAVKKEFNEMGFFKEIR